MWDQLIAKKQKSPNIDKDEVTVRRPVGRPSIHKAEEHKERTGPKNKLHPGDVVGEWTLVSYMPSKKKNGKKIQAKWACVCSCGVMQDVQNGNLVQRTSLSCGHNKAQKISEYSKARWEAYRAANPPKPKPVKPEKVHRYCCICQTVKLRKCEEMCHKCKRKFNTLMSDPKIAVRLIEHAQAQLTKK